MRSGRDQVRISLRGRQDGGDPEAQQASLNAWNAWFGTLGEAIVDGGNPFTASATVSSGGATNPGRLGASGYSLVTANSLQDAVSLAKGCPVIADGGAVDVYETIEM